MKIPRVMITFVSEDGSVIEEVTTDNRGSYQISLRIGRYVASAAHPDYEVYSTAPGFIVVREGRKTFNIYMKKLEREFVIAKCAGGLGFFDQECKDKEGKGYPIIDGQERYKDNPTCKTIDMCGIQAHAGYYVIGSGGKEFEFDIDKYPSLYLTMKAETGTDTCLVLKVHDKEPKDYMRRFVAIGKTREGNRSCVSVGAVRKDWFTIEDDNKWHDYIYDLRKLRGKYPDAKTVRKVQFYSGKLCNGISRTVHFFHFSSLIFKSRK